LIGARVRTVIRTPFNQCLTVADGVGCPLLLKGLGQPLMMCLYRLPLMGGFSTLKKLYFGWFRMIERHMDYFAASLNFPEIACRESGYKLVNPIAFYKRGWVDENGVRYYYGNPNSKKALAVLSGQCLETLRALENTDAQIIDAFLSRGARCSRLDLAVTEWVENDLVTLEDVERWYKQDKIKSTWLAGGCKMIVDVPKEDLNVAQTIYIGSQADRGKKGIFRAYDKGVEMDLGKYMVTRLEVEDRGDKANVSANRLAKTNDVAGVFRTRFDVDEPEFERLMQSPVAELTRRSALPKRDEIDAQVGRWKWLIEKIAPSVKQAIADDKRLDLGDTNMSKFLVASGLMGVMRDAATDLANKRFYDKLRDAGLLETDFSE